jgi:calpain-7
MSQDVLDMPWDDVCDVFEGIDVNWDPLCFKYSLDFHGLVHAFLSI